MVASGGDVSTASSPPGKIRQSKQMAEFRGIPSPGLLLLLGMAWVAGFAQEPGPELKALSFAPHSIDTTNSAARVTVNFETVDRGPGATSFEIGFASPSGVHSQKAATTFPAAGSFTGSVSVAFPALSEPGAWTISHVLLANAEGYSRMLTEKDLGGSGLPTILNVVSRMDASAPVVRSLKFSPTVVDVTSVSADVSIEMEAQDDLSGVKAIEISFESPSGMERRHVSTTLPNPSTSTKVPLVMKFAPSSEAGTWRAVGLVVADAAGNTLVMNADDFVSRGFPSEIQVRKVVDTTPPTLTEFKLTPSKINLASGSAEVNVEFALADDLSGAAGLEISFLGPSGNMARKAEATFKPGSLVTGSVKVRFPGFSEIGVWQVAALLLVDAAGNTRVLNAGDLSAKGFPNRILVGEE